MSLSYCCLFSFLFVTVRVRYVLPAVKREPQNSVDKSVSVRRVERDVVVVVIIDEAHSSFFVCCFPLKKNGRRGKVFIFQQRLPTAN